ncbi:MAG TPA: hypothetical protein RMH99_19745 [Sandaracinaceae bacterium LLY-WYZ-13_1]|nr:hypothetical protein [Sandaracinaceae bacterium LLY-WYZ-13_1]
MEDLRRPGPAYLIRRIERPALARILADPQWTRGLWLQLLGRFEESLAPLEEAHRRRDAPTSRAELSMHLLPTRLALGRLTEAVEAADEARAAFADAGDVGAEAYAAAMGALAHQERGDTHAASEGLEHAYGLYADRSMPRERTVVAGYRGELFLERGERTAARVWIHRALASARELPDPDLVAWLTSALAASTDDLDEAVVRLLEAAGAIDDGGRDLRDLIELRYGHVDLLKCASAAGREARGFLERALARRDRAPEARRVELRTAARILDRAIDARRWTVRGGLEVDAGLAWARTPHGAELDLARRPVLRRVFEALIAARRRRRGAGLDVHQLFAAAWPGERALPEAAANRVYVAVARLRKLGLGDTLRTGPDGFYLDPAVALLETTRPCAERPADV